MRTRSSPLPLDLERTGYSYAERHNSTLVDLVARHVLEGVPSARILDVGCGAGANGRAIRTKHPNARLVGIEPNARAAELARDVYDEVFEGDVRGWLDTDAAKTAVDGIILSDVLEHVVDPIAFLRLIASLPAVRTATWVVSVPNYGVWYNRVNTLLGRFEYSWSGLYDRTHLRFFTRRSIRRALEYAGLRIVGEDCTPSIVQSLAPILRRFYQADVDRGEHLSLEASPAYRVYTRAVEPAESAFCRVWPELLGFQIVTVATLRA